MSTQEERLSTLEQTVTVLSKGIRDIHYNETILLGLVSEQGKDIREMKVSLGALNERLDVFEQSVTNRFDTLEQGVNSRFETLEGRFDTLEQSVNSRFEGQDKRFEEQDKKLDQVLLLLNTLIPRPEQEK
jgi:hypothetical protein